MDISKLTEWLKLTSEQLLGLLLFVSTVLGALLFAPTGWITALGLQDISDEYKSIFGLALLLCVSLLIVRSVLWLSRYILGRFKEKRRMETMRRRLHSLTPRERDILRRYIEEETRTQYLDITDGVVRGLRSEAIIYQSANISVGHTVFAHNIQPWAWDYLTENPNLVNE